MQCVVKDNVQGRKGHVGVGGACVDSVSCVGLVVLYDSLTTSPAPPPQVSCNFTEIFEELANLHNHERKLIIVNSVTEA